MPLLYHAFKITRLLAPEETRADSLGECDEWLVQTTALRLEGGAVLSREGYFRAIFNGSILPREHAE